MATWRAENSMLTQRGVEILNKIKAGSGSISVTRIVAGSGRVSESHLYQQTSISGDTKEMEISAKTTTETGSEIIFYVVNDGFTSSFDLHQIGVYVTHPDYVGEQLYHISQCDEDDFDTIPAFADTPVTQGYSIYMEHGNSDAISLTVDPQGMVTRKEFEERLANVGGSSTTNLLHNWFFRNPISTKGGRIALSGTPYYSNTGLTSQVGTLSAPCKATHVNGNYSTIVISNTTYYVRSNATRYGYTNEGGTPCFDRWILSNSSSYIYKDSNGAVLGLSPNSGSLSQNLAAITSAMYFGGLTYTFSVNVVSLSGGTPVLTFDNGDETFETPITETGIVSLTVSVPKDSGAVVVGIRNNHATEVCTMQISAAKVEVGEKSTLENDPPADYAEQMAICVQFDPETDMYRGFPSPVTANILAEASITQ